MPTNGDRSSAPSAANCCASHGAKRREPPVSFLRRMPAPRMLASAPRMLGLARGMVGLARGMAHTLVAALRQLLGLGRPVFGMASPPGQPLRQQVRLGRTKLVV